MHCHITKQVVHFFLVNISQPSIASVNITILRLTNPDVNLKRMNQLYFDICLERSLSPDWPNFSS